MAIIKNLSPYLKNSKIKVGNFIFDTNEIINFASQKNKYKLSTDQKKYEAFKNLCNLYNQKIKKYQDNKIEYIQYLNTYKTLVKMESSSSDNEEIFLDSQIQKEINFFRKLKIQFNDQLERTKIILDNVKENKKFNLKARINAKLAMSRAEKALNNFKYARRDIKNNAKIKGTITSSTFKHSIINFKNKNIPETYTGILGSLISVCYFIKEYGYNDKWKKLKLKEIEKMQTRLEYGSKGYESSRKVFDQGNKLAEKFESNKNNITGNKNNMKEAIKALKSKINTFFNQQLEILKSKTSNSSIKSCAKKIQKDFETRRSDWINEYKEIFNDEKNLGAFIDIYFQTKSLAILNGKSNKFSKFATGYYIFTGVAFIILGGIYCTVCVPAGIIIMVVGIGIIIGSAVAESHTSGFKENERAFSEAVSKSKEEGNQNNEKLKQ